VPLLSLEPCGGGGGPAPRSITSVFQWLSVLHKMSHFGHQNRPPAALLTNSSLFR
jgi:hypothetical protein